jgi:acyl transferase domain-containing protein
MTFGTAPKDGRQPAVAFMFVDPRTMLSSDVSEWLKYSPTFLRTIRRLDEILARLGREIGLEARIQKSEMATTTAGKDRMPCLVGAAMQIALVDVLAKWNVHPTASFAHHGGEFLAAYSSGHLSAPEVLLLLDCAATGQDSHAKIRELNNEDLAWRRPSTTVASLVPGDALDILLSRSTTRGSMPKETNGYERSLAETFENIEVDNIVEIGQSSRLPDQMNISHERITALWECRRKAVSFSDTLAAAGALYILGYPVDLEEANAVHGVDWKPMLLVDLPPYQWDHSRSMIIESHALREERLCGAPYHELLGRRVHGLSPRSMIWKNSFVQDNVSWLYGSRVSRSVISTGKNATS